MNSAENLTEDSNLAKLISERWNVVENAPFDIDSELMEVILDFYNQPDNSISPQNFNKFTLTQVLAYLQASHKWYLTKKLPEIEQTMVHIFSKYAETHQLEITLTSFFNEYKNRLVAHIRMEEKEFFPYIKKLIEASEKLISPLETIEFLNQGSIEDFNDNHDPIEDDLKEVSAIIHKYEVSKDTPLPYRVFLNQVEIFELELRKHALIEDYILVPMTRQLENDLRAELL